MFLNLLLISDEQIGLIIAVALTAAIIIFAFVAFAIALVKRAKKAKKVVPSVEERNSEIVEAFGSGNIKEVEMEMSRITVRVANVEVVNTERIKELGASGILLGGDKIKCSFKENVEEIYNQLKGAITNE